MKNNLKVLTLSLLTLMSSATFAQTSIIGGVTIQRPDHYGSYGNTSRDEYMEDRKESANTPSNADRIRAMEQDFAIGEKPAAQTLPSNVPPEMANGIDGVGGSSATNSKEDSKGNGASVAQPTEVKKAPAKTYRKSVIPKVAVGSSGSFNTATIHQTEQEAIQRDSARYQEFLSSIHKN